MNADYAWSLDYIQWESLHTKMHLGLSLICVHVTKFVY